MSGLTKEILLDYGMGRVSLEEKFDIDLAIKDITQRGDITRIEKKILMMYIYGYTANEIASEIVLPTELVELSLTHTIQLLSARLNIHDEDFIDRVKDTVRQSKIEEFRAFLEQHDKHYTTHNVKKGIPHVDN